MASRYRRSTPRERTNDFHTQIPHDPDSKAFLNVWSSAEHKRLNLLANQSFGMIKIILNKENLPRKIAVDAMTAVKDNVTDLSDYRTKAGHKLKSHTPHNDELIQNLQWEQLQLLFQIVNIDNIFHNTYGHFFFKSDHTIQVNEMGTIWDDLCATMSSLGIEAPKTEQTHKPSQQGFTKKNHK